MTPESRIEELGLRLPKAQEPLASYRSAVRSGNLLFIAGQGPLEGGKPTVTGRLGEDVTIEQGYEAARVTCLNALAVIRQAVGSLDAVRRAVKATVYVASAKDFTQQPKVADGVTDLLRDIWGEEGLPARAAVGVNVLPMNLPVELELAVELK
jgi:enamine deaminase RidA (YjgF/YER057c/UK114 family)